MVRSLLNLIEFLVLFGLCTLAFLLIKSFGWKADLTTIIAGAALYRAIDAGRGK